MPGPRPARPGRHAARTARTALVLTAFGAIVGLVAAGTPGGATEDPASVPEAAAAAEPSPTPATPGPSTNPLAAPATSPSSPAATPSPTPKPVPTSGPVALALAARRATVITDRTKDWASFTLIDRQTKKTVGDSRAAQTTFTESTVKAWLAADLLATRAREGTTPSAYETTRMTAMIRLSDDNAAEFLWRTLGADAAIVDMIKTCGLVDTTVYHDWWSKTMISSRDLARLGDCIVPGKGRFLSPQVGAPLVALMRSVDPTNAFGIQQAQPAGKGVHILVKNGWTEHGASGQWNVNCLGIWGPGSRWVLAVTIRYPIPNGLGYGAEICRRVTAALFPVVKTG
jgi:Beta-lactamase enzyme family